MSVAGSKKRAPGHPWVSFTILFTNATASLRFSSSRLEDPNPLSFLANNHSHLAA